MTPTIENHTLTIGDHSEPLPHLPQAARVHVWAVPAEYRASGYFASVQAHGQPVELPACDAATATSLGTLDLPASEAAQLDAARAERMAATNAQTDQLLAALSVAYPEREVLSWDQQLKEAGAYAVDPLAATPLLSALAQARGIDLAALALKVLEKGELYAVGSGRILGARQRIEDMLAAATTADDVNAVPAITELLADLEHAA